MKKKELFTVEKPVSHRQKKVASEIRHILSDVLSRGNLPVILDEETEEELSLPGPVTITHVDVSADLKNAKVFVMPLGGLHCELTLQFLKACDWFFRKEMAHSLMLRAAPRIRFVLDDSFERGAYIDALLQK